MPELVKELFELYQKKVTTVVQKKFTIEPPKSIVPDFSEDNIIDKYVKKTNKIKGTEIDIDIEEYKVRSPEGDELVFAMAHDSEGRFYIDNIYDPNIGIDSYGTPKQIVNMGFLVYKPEDYSKQAYTISQDYKDGEDGSKYKDINKLRMAIPIIKKYSESVKSRS